MILQLKTGHLEPAYFRGKFGTDILQEFAEGFGKLAETGQLTIDDGGVQMTRTGLLQVDRLLPAFFDPEYRGSRYA